MHWADIIAAIKKANTTLAAIAEAEDVSRPFVTQVIRGERRSHKVAYAIAAASGLSTEKMWPGVYLTPPAYKKARQGYEQGRLPKAANQ